MGRAFHPFGAAPLFEGKLPDLNLGTANGGSCDPALAQQLLQIAEAAPGYTAVLNGRFKGGHITRHYGQPGQGVHAVQLEMTQCSYMQECLPFDYLPEPRAVQVQPHLQRMLAAALDFARAIASEWVNQEASLRPKRWSSGLLDLRQFSGGRVAEIVSEVLP